MKERKNEKMSYLTIQIRAKEKDSMLAVARKIVLNGGSCFDCMCNSCPLKRSGLCVDAHTTMPFRVEQAEFILEHNTGSNHNNG